MGRLIEELDYRETAMGPLILRRRWVAAIDADVVEVILGEEHLMSSLFTVGETELAVRGLARGDGRAACGSSSAVWGWATRRARRWPTIG